MKANTTTRTRPAGQLPTSNQQARPIIPTNSAPPPDLSEFGEKLLTRLVARFEKLHTQVKALDFTNYEEYIGLKEQLEHLHAQFEKAATAGDIGSKGAGNDFF